MLSHLCTCVTGMLVDRTGQYTYVFLACSISVALSALFLMVSFYWLDSRDAAQKKSSPASGSPAKPVINISTDCQYSSVPTDGDKANNPSSEAENVTNVWPGSELFTLAFVKILVSHHRFALYSICHGNTVPYVNAVLVIQVKIISLLHSWYKMSECWSYLPRKLSYLKSGNFWFHLMPLIFIFLIFFCQLHFRSVWDW